MAQEWAKPLYSSPAWKHNRKVYLNLVVDGSGHRLYLSDDGSTYYWVDEYGGHVTVSPDSVVPPGMCELCHSRGKMTPAKVVHHVIHLNPENVNDPHVSLSFDNFQRLCQDCHAEVHSDMGESRVSFDEFGNVIWKEG